jgi:bisphosphoglycerate-dependent phosphoglycerate mutase
MYHTPLLLTTYHLPPHSPIAAQVSTPGGESLGDCIGRCMPVWRDEITADLREGRNVLVVSSM